VASDDAEAALCADRPTFIMRHEILKRTPGKIKKCITFPGDIAQIEGFQELFIYLTERPGSKALHRLIVSSIAGFHSLREHLSQ